MIELEAGKELDPHEARILATGLVMAVNCAGVCSTLLRIQGQSASTGPG